MGIDKIDESPFEPKELSDGPKKKYSGDFLDPNFLEIQETESVKQSGFELYKLIRHNQRLAINAYRAINSLVWASNDKKRDEMLKRAEVFIEESLDDKAKLLFANLRRAYDENNPEMTQRHQDLLNYLDGLKSGVDTIANNANRITADKSN